MTSSSTLLHEVFLRNETDPVDAPSPEPEPVDAPAPGPVPPPIDTDRDPAEPHAEPQKR